MTFLRAFKGFRHVSVTICVLQLKQSILAR